MKKILKNITLVFMSLLLVSCGNKSKDENVNIDEIKNIIDYVLSYDGGYDDNMKKHISEENFYVANYIEFYSLYLGETEITKFESKIINYKENKEIITLYMTIDMMAYAKEIHIEEGQTKEEAKDQRDSAVGEDVPVEVIVKLENGNYVIKSFKEYENLDVAKEMNEGFK